MDYSILRYGAVADGVTNCAAAIQQAVDAAAAAGGGRVIVPAGRFLSCIWRAARCLSAA